MEGDKSATSTWDLIIAFQSTPSAWRETRQKSETQFWKNYFNPLPPHGGRPFHHLLPYYYYSTFQSTPSAWRETTRCLCFSAVNFISIHSLRLEGDGKSERLLSRSQEFQSTPSAWRETRSDYYVLLGQHHFNPLPPHGGRR